MPSESAPFGYPPFYLAANAASKTGQDRYMGAVRLRLSALVVAALGGALSWKIGSIEIFGWVALVAFVTSLGVEVYILAVQPDQLWYEGRAAAESVKTLAWRYAVRGDPFGPELSDRAADERLLSQIRAITQDLTHLAMPPLEGAESQIPRSMLEMRRRTFEDQRSAYARGRIDDQIGWYANKAQENTRRLHQFMITTIALEIVGVLGAVLRLTGVVELDLLGVVAAIIAGLASWAQTRQYGPIGRAYSIASHELMTIKSQIRHQQPNEWPRFIDAAEQAISREHTLWRASKGVLATTRAGG